MTTTTTTAPKTTSKQTSTTAETSAKKKTETPTSPSRVSGVLSRVKTGAPVVIWAAVIRVLTIIADFVLISVTALNLIPLLGAYIHEQSGASTHKLTSDGTVAVWLVPFLFVVTLLTVLEIILMRKLWAVGTRRIAKIKQTAHPELADQDTEEAKPALSPRTSATKKKRKK